ncbi:hypothetical protein OsI_34166 [Oryza sativa Indica Group]|uniref:SWIM-type domain-containing protein n=1 Tax=Oryza sativa subsp. indica TaxID=39946 RepID=B8BHN4_ORYSI|nr:hypothetical protein OsI_34166 [Oryza sativa Indica Group]
MEQDEQERDVGGEACNREGFSITMANDHREKDKGKSIAEVDELGYIEALNTDGIEDDSEEEDVDIDEDNLVAGSSALVNTQNSVGPSKCKPRRNSSGVVDGNSNAPSDHVVPNADQQSLFDLGIELCSEEDDGAQVSTATKKEEEENKTACSYKDMAMREYGVDVSKIKAYMARSKAYEKVLGNHKKQYLQIRDYLQTVINTNLGSRCVVKTLQNPKPGVDGCFIKLTNGAQVLVATARDGNNNLFPLAFGVVGKEDADNWIWFLNQLKYALDDNGDCARLTIMSERQMGLLHAIKSVFPDCAQRYCKRHLYQNFCTAGYKGGDLKVLMDQAVYAYTKSDFNIAMEELKKENANAWDWLNKIPHKHWARHAFDSRCKTDLVVNNLSEAFNNYIIGSRDKPIVTMLEMIRTKLMEKCNDKREGVAAAKWEITPHYIEKLELEKTNSRYCRPVCAGRGIWQVSCGEYTYAVHLENRTCGCFKWDVTGIPCNHAISAIYKLRQYPEDYVNDFFKKATYEKAYQHLIYPVPGEHDWIRTTTPDIDPPKFNKHPGRPKKSRRKSAGEETQHSGRVRMTTITCSNCKNHGHKYISCPQPLRPDLKIRKRKYKSNRVILEELSYSQEVTFASTLLHGNQSTGMASTDHSIGRGRARGGGRARGRGRAMHWFGVDHTSEI